MTPDRQMVLTVDANVINYVSQYQAQDRLPAGLATCSMEVFCTAVLDRHPIAVNDFIRTEYDEVAGYEWTKHWIKHRQANDLVMQVPARRLGGALRTCLRDEYGRGESWFARDGKYVGTCANTSPGKLVTENLKDFQVPHKAGRKRKSMDAYLFQELGIRVWNVDTCCSNLVDAS